MAVITAVPGITPTVVHTDIVRVIYKHEGIQLVGCLFHFYILTGKLVEFLLGAEAAGLPKYLHRKVAI